MLCQGIRDQERQYVNDTLMPAKKSNIKHDKSERNKHQFQELKSQICNDQARLLELSQETIKRLEI